MEIIRNSASWGREENQNSQTQDNMKLVLH